jgi:two-component system, OmpR family, aerobic respiration control sensor histidine kinase ArcB
MLKENEMSKTNPVALILVVEDSFIAAKAAQVSLKRLGCASNIAENGTQAIKMVQNNNYDLILMDIGLPDFDGVETTKRIRALNDSKISQVPIVALTGLANNSEKREESLAVGMQEVLTKPLPQSKLETILQEYVFNKEQQVIELPEDEITLKRYQNIAEIIDWDTCLSQLNNDEECLRELLSILSIDLKITQETLAKAYAAQDNDALRAELHRVRGGVSYLALPQLDKALTNFHEIVRITPVDNKQIVNAYTQLQQTINTFCETLAREPFNLAIV